MKNSGFCLTKKRSSENGTRYSQRSSAFPQTKKNPRPFPAGGCRFPVLAQKLDYGFGVTSMIHGPSPGEGE